MRYHKLPFDSGDLTCAKLEEGKPPEMCPLAGTIKFGTVWVCRRFPSDAGAYTLLAESSDANPLHRVLLRCPDCLLMEATNG